MTCASSNHIHTHTRAHTPPPHTHTHTHGATHHTHTHTTHHPPPTHTHTHNTHHPTPHTYHTLQAGVNATEWEDFPITVPRGFACTGEKGDTDPGCKFTTSKAYHSCGTTKMAPETKDRWGDAFPSVGSEVPCWLSTVPQKSIPYSREDNADVVSYRCPPQEDGSCPKLTDPQLEWDALAANKQGLFIAGIVLLSFSFVFAIGTFLFARRLIGKDKKQNLIGKDQNASIRSISIRPDPEAPQI
jgi:hypothetical protein